MPLALTTALAVLIATPALAQTGAYEEGPSDLPCYTLPWTALDQWDDWLHEYEQWALLPDANIEDLTDRCVAFFDGQCVQADPEICAEDLEDATDWSCGPRTDQPICGPRMWNGFVDDVGRPYEQSPSAVVIITALIAVGL